jgi:hypothetical protein
MSKHYLYYEDENGQAQYGNIQSACIKDMNGIIFFIKTMHKTDHEKMVDSVVKMLLNDNDDKYTSWRETARRFLYADAISKITLVSFRVRDAW